MRAATDRSPSLEEALDFSSFESLQRRTDETASQGGPSHAAQVQDLPQRPSITQPSRLENIRSALTDRAFSQSAVDRIAAARRPSTLKVYEGKWKVFCKWCEDNDLQPLVLLVPQLADFFIWLFEVRSLAPITIKGYRSMIADTYRHHGRQDVGKDKDLSDLVANFDRSRPRTTYLFPRWDLALVLRYLSSNRFEPL